MRDLERGQSKLLLCGLMGIGVLILLSLVICLVVNRGGSIVEFSLEEPKGLKNETEARVCGDLRVRGIRLDDLQVFVYVKGLEPERSEWWWRNKDRCPATKNAGEWTLPSECTSFPENYNQFVLVAVLVEKEKVPNLPSDVRADDIEDLKLKLLQYVYKANQDAISREFEVEREILVSNTPFGALEAAAETATATFEAGATAIARETAVAKSAAVTAAAEKAAAAEATETAAAKTAIVEAETTTVAEATETAIAETATAEAEKTAAAEVVETAVAKTATAAADATATAAAKPTPPPPTPVLPELLEPESDDVINDENVYFKWKWEGTPLAEKEFFAVRMWHQDKPPEKESITWTKDQTYPLTLKDPPVPIEFGPGYYYWNIAVVRELCTPREAKGCWEPVCESEPRRLYIKVSPPPTPTNTPLVPTPTPTPTEPWEP